MTISNETKVGAIAAVTITVLVLGFNFLKGKSLFGKSHTLYAKYTNVQGLAPSNAVKINGLEVGSVYKITTDKNMKVIVVNINMTKDVNIPVNSVALIKSSLLGVTSIDIKLGDAEAYIPENDTIPTAASSGMFSEVMGKVDPVLYQVTRAVNSIDSVLIKINQVIDPEAKHNIAEILGNLNKTSAHLIGSAESLEKLLNTETGALSKTLNNMNSVTANLAASNGKITNALNNIDKTAANLASLDFQKTLNTLNGTINDLKSLVGKVNTNSGTLGLLLNDSKLYNNLTATANKLNLLIDDIKTNPKRYISISIFGKKNNSPGLTVPLPDTVNAPYLKQK
jgi:phospholipid/cholesterol/gamma-HCH transport system substrate-binding protein